MVPDQSVICDCIMISIFQTGCAAPLSVAWGPEANQTVTCISWESCGFLQESSGKSPSVATVLFYHMRDKDDTKSQVESGSFLQLRRAVSFYITVVGHMARKKITRKRIVPQAFHFLLNFLCTVTQEVLKSSGSFIHWPCKVCRQLYSREKETY